jgi:hypothetical protein
VSVNLNDVSLDWDLIEIDEDRDRSIPFKSQFSELPESFRDWRFFFYGDQQALAAGHVVLVGDAGYDVMIMCRRGFRPHIVVLSPPILDGAPNLMDDGSIDIFGYGEWDPSMRYSDTIFHWIERWVSDYEVWVRER